MSPSLLTQGEFPGYLSENLSIPKYDSAREDRFPHIWLDVNKTEVSKDLKEIGDLIVKAIPEVPKGDTELNFALRGAESLHQIPRSEPVKVAFIGPQGAGKSLALNALFDRDGLSLTGDDGHACTSVMIKYLPHDRNTASEHVQSYIAKIKFFDAVKLEQMIAEHARAYFHYQHFDEDSDDEDGPKVQSVDQDESDRRMKDTAEEIFHTLFGGKEQFQDAWNPNAYRSGEFERLCQVKCEQALSRLDIDSKRIKIILSEDVKDLQEKIKPFIATLKNQHCLWPLVDHVAIQIRDSLLDENIECIDQPGWGDINTMRARHADEVKDQVDVEIILAPTSRIATEDLVISNVRAAALNHGAARVKLVATKIDIISENQLDQCSGPNYDAIKIRIHMAENDAIQADEEGDAVKSDQSTKYKMYLERYRKQRKVTERAKNISKDLSMKLKGRSSDDSVQVFHISAANYLDWTKKAKLSFREHPALFPEETGIPNLRRFLSHLPAQQNLDDYKRYVFVTVPTFVDKIRRIANNTDRDVGFRNLADECDKLRSQFIPELLRSIKESFRKIITGGMNKMRPDLQTFRNQTDAIVDFWIQIKAPAFARILKCKGVIPPGTSRAKGLESGCNWNQELANVLTPGFKKVYSVQLSAVGSVGDALTEIMKHFNGRVLSMMDNSTSSLDTIEKAKKKWKTCSETMEIKLSILIDEVRKKMDLLIRRATMEDSRQNSFISTLTDSIFDDVFKACPDERSTSTPERRKYVEPKVRFQRRAMCNHFCEASNHFVDRAMKEFQQLIDSTLSKLLGEQIEGIDKHLGEFSVLLRSFAPLEYQITEKGVNIRSQLENIIPKLDEKMTRMRQWFPRDIKQEPDSQLEPYGTSDNKDADVDLRLFFDRVLKRKKTNSNMSQVKVKQELGIKRPRIE